MAKAQQPTSLDDIASFTVSGAAGEYVYKAGDSSKHFFIVQEGRIELVEEAGATARQIAVYEAGDCFGESALVDEAPRDASARGVTPYRVLRLDRAVFAQLAQENPDIPVQIARRLASRLRAAARSAVPAPVPAPPPAAAPAPASAPAKPCAAGVLVHAGSGTEFPLKDTGATVVGRHDRATHFTPDIDLSVLDEQRTLSRRHATISRQGTAFHIQESATRNGTFVNGKRVPSGVDVELNDGDVVRFGMIETVFRCR